MKLLVLLSLFVIIGCTKDQFPVSSTPGENQQQNAGTPTPPPNPSLSPSPSPTTNPNPTPSPSATPVFPVDNKRYFDERELVIRSFRNFEEEANINRVLDLVKNNNFNTISIQIKQDEDDPEEVPSGSVFYASKIAPIPDRYKKWDIIKALITGAKQRGLRVKAWMPLFHDQQAALAHPDWAMKALVNGKVVAYTGSNASKPEYFVNPLNTDVQNYQISILKEFLTNYQVDSVVFDWIRFDNYHMDMSDATRAAYKTYAGIDPITIDFTKNNATLQKWNDWRTTKLAEFTKRITDEARAMRPGIELGAYILPPEFLECGQDAAKLSPYLDFFAPMAYHVDFQKPLSWIYDTIIPQTVTKANGKKVIPTLDHGLTAAQYEEVFKALETKYPKMRSVSFFKYQWWDLDEAQFNDTVTKKK